MVPRPEDYILKSWMFPPEPPSQLVNHQRETGNKLLGSCLRIVECIQKRRGTFKSAKTIAPKGMMMTQAREPRTAWASSMSPSFFSPNFMINETSGLAEAEFAVQLLELWCNQNARTLA